MFAGYSDEAEDEVNLDLKLLIDVWDEDFFPKIGKDFIGYYELTIAEILECAANKTALVMNPPPIQHNQNPGKLYIDVAMLGFPKVRFSR